MIGGCGIGVVDVEVKVQVLVGVLPNGENRQGTFCAAESAH